MTNPDYPVIRNCILISLGTNGIEVTGNAVITDCQIEATTHVYVNAGGVAYIRDNEGTTYDGAGAVEPLAGDRSARDALNYQARHANDIDNAAGIHHTQAQIDRRYLKRTDLLIPPPRLDAIANAQQVVNPNIGTFGDATHAPQLTLDRYGRVTQARSIPIISREAMSMNQAVGGSGVTRSGATTDGHLAVWNGSSVDSIKDGGAVPAGTTGDFLVMQVFS